MKKLLQKATIKGGFQVYDLQWKVVLGVKQWVPEEEVTLPAVTSYPLQLLVNKEFRSLPGGGQFYSEVRQLTTRLLPSVDTHAVEKKSNVMNSTK